ncbi:hypothetical protein JVT61DRAFT_2554 [Boletus reticuloceps]|uniref:Zn(2)-C6 fungal-type domain-containing protein n=1 Tax=Boletus reticuloceps TaxID=495285 RepID=A0A8I3A1V2_9AGAM|nr:hypothetical protein JVT61DRAFT_2554 [Boletus reticuloceps]
MWHNNGKSTSQKTPTTTHTPFNLSANQPPSPTVTIPVMFSSANQFTQGMIEECAEEVRKIFEKLVLPRGTSAEMQARWDEAVELLTRQLNMVRAVVTEGIFIPRFIISLDIHLAMSQGRWPPWQLIMDGNVSAQLDHPWMQLRSSTPPLSPATSRGSAPRSEASQAAPESPSRISFHGTSPRKSITSPNPATAASDKGKGKAQAPPPQGPPQHSPTGHDSDHAPSRSRAEDKRKGPSRGSCKGKEKAQEPSETHEGDVEETRGRSTERALSVGRRSRNRSQARTKARAPSPPRPSPPAESTGSDTCDNCLKHQLKCTPIEGRACAKCYESKVRCSLLAKKRPRSASRPRSKARPSRAKSSTSRSQEQEASTSSVNSPNVPTKNTSPSASPSANDKDRDSSPPPKRTRKSKPSIFGPSQGPLPTSTVVVQTGPRWKQSRSFATTSTIVILIYFLAVLEGVVLPSTKRHRPLVIPTAQSTSGTPAHSTPSMPTVADEDRPVNATEHNMVLEELQRFQMEQVKTDQHVQTLED